MVPVLAELTSLLQKARLARDLDDPIGQLFEAADAQWASRSGSLLVRAINESK